MDNRRNNKFYEEEVGICWRGFSFPEHSRFSYCNLSLPHTHENSYCVRMNQETKNLWMDWVVVSICRFMYLLYFTWILGWWWRVFKTPKVWHLWIPSPRSAGAGEKKFRACNSSQWIFSIIPKKNIVWRNSPQPNSSTKPTTQPNNAFNQQQVVIDSTQF